MFWIEGGDIKDTTIEGKCGFILSDDLLLELDRRDIGGAVSISLGKHGYRALLHNHSALSH